MKTSDFGRLFCRAWPSHVRRSIPATTRSVLHACSGKEFRQLWRPRPKRGAEQRHYLSPSHVSTSRKADLLWRGGNPGTASSTETDRTVCIVGEGGGR